MDLLWVTLKESSIPFRYEIYGGIQRISIGPFRKRDEEYKEYEKKIGILCLKNGIVAMRTALDLIYENGIFVYYASFIWIFNLPIDEFRKRRLGSKLNDTIGTVDGEDEIEEKDWEFLQTSKIEDPHSLFETIQKNKEIYQLHVIPEMLERTWHPSRFQEWCM